MKLLRVELMLVIVVILSFGWQAKPTEATVDTCHRPEVLFSYLDIDRYNKSYPYVDYEAIVKPVLDHMLYRSSGVIDIYADLFTYWNMVCRAEDPEKEEEAWRTLAYELNQRMHTDDSVYKIVKILFGDKMVARIMNPSRALIFSELSTNECYYRLIEIYVQHCGQCSGSYSMKHINTFMAMCALGVKEQELDEAASQTCIDNVYIRPVWD